MGGRVPNSAFRLKHLGAAPPLHAKAEDHSGNASLQDRQDALECSPTPTTQHVSWPQGSMHERPSPCKEGLSAWADRRLKQSDSTSLHTDITRNHCNQTLHSNHTHRKLCHARTSRMSLSMDFGTPMTEQTTPQRPHSSWIAFAPALPPLPPTTKTCGRAGRTPGNP